MEIVNETKKQTLSLLLGGLALTVGLGWNEAVKSGIEEYFPIGKGDGIRAKFIYAIALTLLMVSITIFAIRTGTYKKQAPCVCADKEDVDKLRNDVNNIIATRNAGF